MRALLVLFGCAVVQTQALNQCWSPKGPLQLLSYLLTVEAVQMRKHVSYWEQKLEAKGLEVA